MRLCIITCDQFRTVISSGQVPSDYVHHSCKDSLNVVGRAVGVCALVQLPDGHDKKFIRREGDVVHGGGALFSDRSIYINRAPRQTAKLQMTAYFVCWPRATQSINIKTIKRAVEDELLQGTGRETCRQDRHKLRCSSK